MSLLNVDKIDPNSGTALEIGTSGDTVTVPTGVGLTLTNATLLLPTTITSTTEVLTNKISPATGVAFALGDSGDTFTVPSGATIVNSGTATGFGGGKIGQVVSTVKTDTFTTTSTSFTDVTDLTVDITPVATSSKILIIASIQVGGSATVRQGLTLVRDSTDIYLGDAAGSRAVATIYQNPQSATVVESESIVFLDSPSSTSATTYKIQAQTESGNTLTINRSLTDTDAATYYRTPSSITVMEVLV